MKESFDTLVITLCVVAVGAGIFFAFRTSNRHDEETWRHWSCPAGYQLQIYSVPTCEQDVHQPAQYVP